MRPENRRGVNGGEVNAFDIDGVALVEIVFTDIQCGLVAVCPAGIVDHHVELAVALHGGIDQGFDFSGLGDIGGKK